MLKKTTYIDYKNNRIEQSTRWHCPIIIVKHDSLQNNDIVKCGHYCSFYIPIILVLVSMA